MAISRLFRSKWFVACLGTVLLIGIVFLIGCSRSKTDASSGKPAAKDRASATSSLMDAIQKALSKPTPKFSFGDQAGYELYTQMIEAMREAKSLSYVSRYEMEGKSGFKIGCTYQAWLKKPNYFRVETESASHEKCGILIGDGNTLWIYWPQGRPNFYGDEEEESEADKQARLTSYMTKPAPKGGHSIGHETGILGAGMSMPIIDPSTFHGYTDSLQQYLDGVKSLGSEKIGDEEREQIEVSIMKGQRVWYIWLSKSDHLPRKLKQIVHVSYDLIMTEDWSSVEVNADIPDTLFAWKPPEDWKAWRMPSPEERLLKPGAKAPEFELASADGTPIKLSDYHGQVVWFYEWRAG